MKYCLHRVVFQQNEKEDLEASDPFPLLETHFRLGFRGGGGSANVVKRKARPKINFCYREKVENLERDASTCTTAKATYCYCAHDWLDLLKYKVWTQ